MDSPIDRPTYPRPKILGYSFFSKGNSLIMLQEKNEMKKNWRLNLLVAQAT